MISKLSHDLKSKSHLISTVTIKRTEFNFKIHKPSHTKKNNLLIVRFKYQSI